MTHIGRIEELQGHIGKLRAYRKTYRQREEDIKSETCAERMCGSLRKFQCWDSRRVQLAIQLFARHPNLQSESTIPSRRGD